MEKDAQTEKETAGGSLPPEGAFRDGARDTGPALETRYRFLLWLAPAVERFPRSQKFLPGDRIQATEYVGARTVVMA